MSRGLARPNESPREVASLTARGTAGRSSRCRPMEDLLLTRAVLFASTNPCSLSRGDMLELVRRAGFGEQSPIMLAVAAERDGLITTQNSAVKELVRLAVERGGVAPFPQ